MFKNSGLFGSSNSDADNAVKVENQSQENPSQNEEPVINSDNSELEKTLTQSLKDLSKEDIAKLQALRSKMISASFGDMVTLLMRSPHYKHYSLADLEWLIIPALLNNQFLVAEAQMKAPAKNEKDSNDADLASASEVQSDETDGQETNASATEENVIPPALGPRIPIGLALWAKVSPEVDAKLSENLKAPIKLRPDEWRSGDINWLVDIVGDQKIMQGLFVRLRDGVFKDQIFKLRWQDKDGKRFVQEIGTVNDKQS